MEEKRTSGAMWVAAVVLLLLVPITAYIAGYFLRCEVSPGLMAPEYPPNNRGLLFRTYPTELEVQLFRPAARIESTLTGKEVSVRAEEALSIFID